MKPYIERLKELSEQNFKLAKEQHRLINEVEQWLYFMLREKFPNYNFSVNKRLDDEIFTECAHDGRFSYFIKCCNNQYELDKRVGDYEEADCYSDSGLDYTEVLDSQAPYMPHLGSIYFLVNPDDALDIVPISEWLYKEIDNANF